jgi:hypothetical protein
MLSARDLARAYDEYVSAVWRGDVEVAPFRAWLAAHWVTRPGALPAEPPAAVSPCGGGGRGIRWYETPAGVCGYVPGASGCYLALPNEAPPALGRPYADLLRIARPRGRLSITLPAPQRLGEPIVAAVVTGSVRDATAADL